MIATIGFVAGFLTMIAFLPQVIKTLRLKEAKGMSLGFCALNLAAAAVWTTYGLLVTKMPLIVSNAIAMAIAASLLALKLRYK